MFSRIAILLALILSGFQIYSQDGSVPTKKSKKINLEIPGTFMVEFGFNFFKGNKPNEIKKGFWGSRTLNIYYQYQVRLFKSKFSFNPGIGISLERFKQANNFTFASRSNPDGTYPLVEAGTLFPGKIKRTQLIVNYFEMPIEFRFDTDPEDIARSFNFSIGGRIGVLFDSSSKVVYSDGERKISKDNQSHGLNRFRYGISARIGISGLSLVGYYNLSPLFEPNKGPSKTEMSTFTIGVSINGF